MRNFNMAFAYRTAVGAALGAVLVNLSACGWDGVHAAQAPVTPVNSLVEQRTPLEMHRLFEHEKASAIASELPPQF